MWPLHVAWGSFQDVGAPDSSPSQGPSGPAINCDMHNWTSLHMSPGPDLWDLQPKPQHHGAGTSLSPCARSGFRMHRNRVRSQWLRLWAAQVSMPQNIHLNSKFHTEMYFHYYVKMKVWVFIMPGTVLCPEGHPFQQRWDTSLFCHLWIGTKVVLILMICREAGGDTSPERSARNSGKCPGIFHHIPWPKFVQGWFKNTT